MSFLVLLGTLAILFLIRVPIAWSLLLSASLTLFLFGNVPNDVVIQRAIAGINSFPLLAIPLFILAGIVMNAGGLTRRLVEFALAFVGRFKGGLAQVNIGASMLMSGVSGAAVADASAMGSIMIPAMRRAGYDRHFSAAVTGSSSIVGPLIPPSIPMVVAGTVANVSVGALFLAGAVPGLVLGLTLMGMTLILARRKDWPTVAPPVWRVVAKRSADAFLALLAPVLVVGGIVGGYFTPTEAAAISCVYTLFIGAVIYREIRIVDLPKIALQTVITTAGVVIIIGAASAFGYVLTLEQAPAKLVVALGPLVDRPWLLLLLFTVVFVVLGAFMESLAIITLVTPVFLPTALAAGIDPIHFITVMVFNLMLGLITPPLGVVMYIVMRISGSTMAEFIRSNAPYYAVLVAVLLLVTFLPGLSTWLPSVFA